MSEYQYYEFQAIDRPLTREQLASVSSLSSRADLTPTRAVFTYSYSNFRGDPLEVLEAHFDVMLYITNWGSKQLAFRFPRSAIDLPPLMPYYWGVEEVSLTTTEQHVLLDFSFNDEEGGHWIDENEASLGALPMLRQDILRGDLRAVSRLAQRRAVSGR